MFHSIFIYPAIPDRETLNSVMSRLAWYLVVQSRHLVDRIEDESIWL
ncbi:MAG: hypothetical protein ACOCXK_01435 [Rhodosalinus sp.]